MGRYAEHTQVSVEKSRGDIEKLLMRYGCDDFAYRNSRTRASIGFKMCGRAVRFDLTLPDPEEYRLTPTGKTRDDAKVMKEWEQGCRRSWRALALVIKAKLEAVESGITEFDIEFLPHMIVPGGDVFHERALPALAEAYETGRMPPLLGSG